MQHAKPRPQDVRLKRLSTTCFYTTEKNYMTLLKDYLC